MIFLYRLLRTMKPFWKQAGISFFFSVATIASSIGLMGTSAFLISRAAQQPSIAELQVAMVGVRFFGVSRGILRYFDRLASHSVNFHLLKTLRTWFYDILEPRVPGIFYQHSSGDLLTRSVSDVDELENFHSRVISPPLTALFITAGVSVFTGKFSPSLGYTLGIGMALTGIINPLMVAMIIRNSGKDYLKQREKIFSTTAENLQGLGELVVFGQQQSSIKKARVSFFGLAKTQIKMIKGMAAARSLNVLFSGLTMWAVLMVAIQLIQKVGLDGVYLAMLITVTMASFEALTPLGESAIHYDLIKSAAQRLFSVENFPLEIQEVNRNCTPGNSNLEIVNLEYRFSQTADPLFKGISFNLPNGKKLGLAGANGTGKTTLLNILLGLTAYDTGTIRLGGCELSGIPLDLIRNRITLLSQTTYLFSGTVKENLLMGNQETNDDQLNSMIDQVGLTPWLKSLDAGLNSWIGERGMRLSGGEKRRLVIARAMLKNADIYLLDEPTQFLDPETEQKIKALLDRISAVKSVIWVSHHLEDLKTMDEILVLEQGGFYEVGSYAHLLRKPGWFSKMHGLQTDFIQEFIEEN